MAIGAPASIAWIWFTAKPREKSASPRAIACGTAPAVVVST